MTREVATQDDGFARIGEPDGGFSMHPITGDEPSGPGHGAVSTIENVETGIAAKDITPDDIPKFIARNLDQFGDGINYLRGWHDPESGKVFLDVSRVVTAEAEVRELAVRHNPLAYFDHGACKSVRVEGRGGGGKEYHGGKGEAGTRAAEPREGQP